MPGVPLLEVRDLRVEVAVDGVLRPAVDGVSFSLEAGECLAVVGESGCGKTLLGRSLVHLLPEGARRTGTISWEGRDLPAVGESEWAAIRGTEVAIVFQEPGSALDPVMTIGAQIAEALHRAGLRDGGAVRARARDLLAEVAFNDPERGLAEYSHRLSGGQRQRACLAIALAGEPSLLIADEPTASLDATVAAEVFDLLDRLRRERHLALLLITHDLASAARRADRALVLYAGRVVETGESASVFGSPSHPYTRALLACVPRLSDAGLRAEHPAARPLASIPGSVPDLGFRPRGVCAFEPRCADRFARCGLEEPGLFPAGVSGGREARCFLWDPREAARRGTA